MAHYHVILFFITFVSLEYCESIQYNVLLRKLNGKFNLLKRNVERDISNLQYEVADLKAELAFERIRSSALEALLNSSDISLPDPNEAPSFTKIHKQIVRQGDSIAKLKMDVESIKKGNTQLEKLSNVTKGHEIDIINMKDSVKKQNTDIVQLKASYQTVSKNISVLANKVTALGDGHENKVTYSLGIVRKAFHDEKNQLRELLKNLADEDSKKTDIDVVSTVENLLNSSVLTAVHEINESCGAVQNQVDNLDTELGQVMLGLNESSKRISSNEVNLKKLNGTYKESSDRIASNEVQLKMLTTTSNESSERIASNEVQLKMLTDTNNREIAQWVKSVASYSSQLYTGSSSYSASQVIGANDDYSKYGSSSLSWSPLHRDANQFLEVNYEKAVYITGVDIYESFNAGSVKRVSARDSGGLLHVLWDTLDISRLNHARIFSPSFPMPTYKSSRIRVDVDNTRGRVMIDAIRLRGFQ